MDATRTGQQVDHAFAAGFADRWHAAWNAHDPDRVAGLCHPDVLLVQTGSPDRHGRLGVADSVRQLVTASHDYSFESLADPLLSADGRHVAVPWRLAGTMTGSLRPPGFAPTGMSFQLLGDDLWEFADGQLISCRVLFDANDLAIQVGASPPSGSMGERVGVLLQHVVARRMRRRVAAGKRRCGSGRPRDLGL